jgi:hypothetical protein
MRKRLPPAVVSSTPVRLKSRAAPGAAQGFVRKSGVVVVPVAHATKRPVARLRISAVKVSKQKQGLG